MLAPIPRNLARWIWVHEAKRAAVDADIQKLSEQIGSLSQESRGLLTSIFRASAYPFNKERERRSYAETLLRLLQQPQQKETLEQINTLLQSWNDFILQKMDDMEFLRTVKFTMQDARDLLENTQHSLSQEDKAFLHQISERCGHTEERIRLQKIFVANAMQSQAVRSQSLQEAFFAQYAAPIEITPLTAATITTTPTPPAISLRSMLAQSALSVIILLLCIPHSLWCLCRVAVGCRLPRGRAWFIPHWLQVQWDKILHPTLAAPSPCGAPKTTLQKQPTAECLTSD